MQTQPHNAKGNCAALEEILAPASLAEFFEGTFGRVPLHLRGTRGRFHHLMDWDGLARLLETCPLEPPRLTIIKAGKAVPSDRYLRRLAGIARIDGGALSLLFDTGATVIINHLDDLLPPIGAIADEIGDFLGARIAINLYANWRSEPGFDPHWDHHDVLVLQLAGRKQWPIFTPTYPDPMRGQTFEAPPAGAEPKCVEVLEDGDVLYLPRGWIHAPVPLDEPSMHLTIAITRPTGAGFLEWLAKELQADPEVRAAAPLRGDPSAVVDWSARMAAIVGAAFEQGAVDRYLTLKDAERAARASFSFPDFGRTSDSEWNQATTLRPASLHRLIVERLPDGTSHVVAGGRPWSCRPPVADALGRLTSTRPVTLGDLQAGLTESDAAQLRQLLSMLVTFGLLSASP